MSDSTKDKDRDILDRRDFMTGSIAAAGAAAIVIGEAATATAQQNSEERGTRAGTIYTGETVQEKKVVSRLDIADLEPGKKHQLYFQGVQAPGGQYWYCLLYTSPSPRDS